MTNTRFWRLDWKTQMKLSSGSIMGITTLDVVLPNPMSSVWRKALVEKVEGEDRTMKDLLLEEDQLWG